MNDLYQLISAKTQALDYSIKQLRKNGVCLAEKEREYKILLRQKCLELRAGGTPVGLIEKICYGIPEVADKRFERDTAEAVYRANLEAINALKLEIRILDSQLEREWGNVK